MFVESEQKKITMNKLEAIQTFLRVADLKSFTKAADDLALPKASVTARVQALESLLGAKLLRRTTRVVELTAEGGQFAERCKILLNGFDEAESMFRTGREVEGTIRVDMIVPLARDIVIPKLPLFYAKHPKIQVEFSGTDHRLDLVKGGIDCVVRGGN